MCLQAKDTKAAREARREAPIEGGAALWTPRWQDAGPPGLQEDKFLLFEGTGSGVICSGSGGAGVGGRRTRLGVRGKEWGARRGGCPGGRGDLGIASVSSEC